MKLKLLLALAAHWQGSRPPLRSRRRLRRAAESTAWASRRPERRPAPSTGTSTGKKDDDGNEHHGNSSCQRVELRGTNGSGSGRAHGDEGEQQRLVPSRQAGALTVPAGSTVGATACVDATGTLTLRSLVVKPPAPPATTTTTTTTTSNTAKAPRFAPQLAPLIDAV